MACPASLLVESQPLLVIAALSWLACWTAILRVAATPLALGISSFGISGFAITAYGRPPSMLPFAVSLGIGTAIFAVISYLSNDVGIDR